MNIIDWSRPEIDQLQKDILESFSEAQILQVREICQNLIKIGNENSLFKQEAGIHGELAYGLDMPNNISVLEHANHLRFFESYYPQKKLKILDLCCGSGEFTHIAKKRNHFCVATEVEGAPNLLSLEPLSFDNRFKLIEARRMLTRKLLGINTHHLKIFWNSQFHQLEEKFDVIYLNQATIHYPGSGTEGYWKNHHWSLFLENLTCALNDDGLIFITLADPTYIHLSDYLLQFYISYSKLFSRTQNERWWTLLLLKKEQLTQIRRYRNFSPKKETVYFKKIGKPSEDTIQKRWTDLPS